MLKLDHLFLALLLGWALQVSSNALAEGFHLSQAHAASYFALLCQQSHSPPSLQKQREEAAKVSCLAEWSRCGAAGSISKQK